MLGFLSNIETFEFDWALYDPDTPRSTLKQFALEFTQNQPADFLDFLMHSYLWTAPPTPQKPGRYAFNPKSLRKTNPARVGHLAPFKNGRGFLHRCVELNHFALLDFLLSCDRARSGFDPNQKDKMGKTPIHLALSGQMHDFIKMLHKHGAALEKLTNKLYTGGFRIGESVLF